MEITFAGDAGEAFARAVAQLPEGYIVALLPEGQDLPDDINDTTFDVSFLSADEVTGVTFHLRDEFGDADRTSTHTRPWADIARVHVY